MPLGQLQMRFGFMYERSPAVDAECAFSASGVSGGTAHGMIPAICLDKPTGKRIDDFKDYLKCQEGALDCPIPAK